MAKTPVLTIDIDDSQFKSFHEMFSKYRDQVKEMPETWRNANEVLNAGIAAVAEQTHNISRNLHAAITAQKQFANATHVSNTAMKTMAKHAHDISNTIFGIGKYILKIGAWGTGLFAGATFGMDKLANSVLGTTTTARGANVTVGQQRAWQTDYAQYAPANMLQSVFAAQHTPEEWGNLSIATGLSVSQIQRMSPAQLGQIAVARAHAYGAANKNNPIMMGANIPAMQGFAALGLNQAGVENLANTPGAELVQARAQFNRDQNALNYGRGTFEGFRSFKRQLMLAGQTIETVLSKRLAQLGPALGGLFTALGKDAQILINGILSPSNLKAVESGLQTFTKFLVSGEAKKDLQSFVHALGKIGPAIEALAHLINVVAGRKDEAKHKLGLVDKFFHASLKEKWKMLKTPLEPSKNPELRASVARSNATLGKFLRGLAQGPFVMSSNGIHVTSAKPALANASKYDDLIGIKGATRALAMVESSGNPNAVSRAGALGLTQVMPDTAKELGVTDWRNPDQNLRAGATYLGRMERFAHGLAPNASPLQNIEMGLASYNWGPGNFEKFWKKHGKDKDWIHELPRETQGEISRFLKNLPQASRDELNTPLLRQIARNTSKPMNVNVTVTTPVTARVANSVNAAR